MNWPELTLERDHETLSILHAASQMIGKVRLANSSWVNHGWHLALQPVPTGFQTLPTAAGDGRLFTLRLDLRSHSLVLDMSDRDSDSISLEAGSVAAVHSALIAMLDRNRLPSAFDGTPNEIAEAVPFRADQAPRSYDRSSAERLSTAFNAMLPVFEHYRAGFTGKSSPTHFWWGGFDLAVSRFNGQEAPLHPGGFPGLPDRITREAYSHEVASAGFWASGAADAEPFFYSYLYPAPAGYSDALIAHAHFDETFGEFVLPYAKVRAAEDPAAMLAEFLQSAYETGVELAKWDRSSLERAPALP